MKSSKPYSIGRIVQYVCTDADKEAQRGAGNVTDVLPAVIVRVLEYTSYENDEVNLKVFCDGMGDLWRTLVPHDQETKAPGTWHWPEIK